MNWTQTTDLLTLMYWLYAHMNQAIKLLLSTLPNNYSPSLNLSLQEIGYPERVVTPQGSLSLMG